MIDCKKECHLIQNNITTDPILVKYEEGEPRGSYRPDISKIRNADGIYCHLEIIA